MSANPEDLAGRVFPAGEPYEVAREKIRDFAAAIGETSPLCHDRHAAQAQGYPDVLAPVTFATVLTLRRVESVISDPESGLDWGRVVHGEERYTVHAPLCAGEQVTVTTTVESVRTVGGNAMVTLRGDLATTAGEPRISVRSMLVVRASEEATP